jgi:hypothetical protein
MIVARGMIAPPFVDAREPESTTKSTKEQGEHKSDI